MLLSSAVFIFLKDSSVIPISLLSRYFWSLCAGLRLGLEFAVDLRSLTFLRKVSFNAFAISLGDVKALPLNLIMLGVLLKDLFEVFK